MENADIYGIWNNYVWTSVVSNRKYKQNGDLVGFFNIFGKNWL